MTENIRCFFARFPGVALAGLLVLQAPLSAAAQGEFVNFETGQVRPLALSPDGTRLFATNTPDNRLEIFDVTGSAPVRIGSVPVGLEPVAVAARSDSEVWVVNHLSDSVSIVDLAATPPQVTQTILTCDEPRDIVFAGPSNERAFVTAARRGQNCSVPDDLTTEGIGRAIVQVYDAATLDDTLAGTPLASLELFADTPRALARSADGSTVYAAAFHSGNQTTAIREDIVCNGGASAPPCVSSGASVPGGLPAPNVDIDGVAQPEVGLIVRFNRDTSKWEDELGRDWSNAIRFDLPDLDVFAIDAMVTPPAQTASFPHVGTVLFNMAVNPVSGKVYVSNTEARNEVRFEGPGLAFGSTSVQGHLHEARITVLDGSNVNPRHLNKHIDYEIRPAVPGVKDHSLATPLGIAVTGDGETVYVSAFGSSKIGVFSASELEDDTFAPSSASHIPVSGGGPTGIVLDELRDRLYVYTRFDNSVSVVSLSEAEETAHVALFNPEPAEVTDGRPVLYDANATSSNGEASCSSCHIFGDFDSLAWDLGNPDDSVLNNPLPFRIPPIGIPRHFHPLKGPMTTQSLRGMANHGSMHWRGDRTGGNDPGGDDFDEDASFKKFNPAFVGLVGRETEISDEDMQSFTDFVLSVTYPPNPIRRLDNALTTAEQEGRDVYFGPVTDVLFKCQGCHVLAPSQGFFGSDGFVTFEGETQVFKVPHLRNVYQKVGMFGTPPSAHLGPQVRGYGVLHDGAIDTVANFLSASVFTLTGTQRNRLQRFVLAFDSNMAPIVGQQTTLEAGSRSSIVRRVDLLIERAVEGECEVVVKGTIDGEQRGGYRLASGAFQMDRAADVRSDVDLRALVATPGQELTYTCAPPGSGARMGVDRDLDGHLDRDEIDEGRDPADPLSFPIEQAPVRTVKLTMRDDNVAPIDPEKRSFAFRSANFHGALSGVVVPPWGGLGDPTVHGGKITIQRADLSTPPVVIELPAGNWSQYGNQARQGYRYRDSKRTAGPITSAMLRDSGLSVSGKGAGLLSLAGAPHGEVLVTLRLGTGQELCAIVPPRAPGAKNDTTARFIGDKNTAPPAACPLIN